MNNSDNCITTLKRLLKLLNIKYTNDYLEESLLTHPDYPSLYAISYTLDKYHIGNMAIKINEEKFNNITTPCIVQVRINGAPFFFVVKKITDSEVLYYNNKGNLNRDPKSEFLKAWTGVCLLVEKTNESKELDILIKQKAINVKKILIGLCALFLIGWIYIGFVIGTGPGSQASLTIPSAFYLFLKFIGLGVSAMLLWYEVDKYNPTLLRFCSGSSNKLNCDEVLNSKYSKFLSGNLSLGSIGFAYFFSSIMVLLIVTFSTSPLAFMAILSLGTIPVILLAIYIQVISLKKWCRLCLTVQGLLVLEVFTVIYWKFYLSPISLTTIPVFMFIFLATILGWIFLKPLLGRKREIYQHKRGLRKIKKNKDVLYSLLAKSKNLNTSVEDIGIVFKSEAARYDVVKVCSPYCGPCSSAHATLESLVKRGEINLRIIFTARADDDDDPIMQPIRHFLAIDAKGDKNKMQEALDKWYNSKDKNYENFAAKYPMNGELQQQDNKINAMRSWCNTENIVYTPTIFINGHQLPNEYDVEDIHEILS